MGVVYDAGVPSSRTGDPKIVPWLRRRARESFVSDMQRNELRQSIRIWLRQPVTPYDEHRQLPSGSDLEAWVEREVSEASWFEVPAEFLRRLEERY